MKYLSRLIVCVIVTVLGLSGPLAAWAAPMSPTSVWPSWQTPKPTSQDIQFGPFVFTAPVDWLAWTYDETLSESENEEALIALVRQIDPALVEEATEVIVGSVPDMVAAAFAPDTPGDALVYISLMAFGYQVSLESLGLTAKATPAQVITALGFPLVEQSNALTAGFLLEEDRDEVLYTGGFALPDQDRIVVLTGGASPLGWEEYGETVQGAIRSFALDDETGTPLEPDAAGPAADLQTGQLDPAQLPVLLPANPQYLYPYEFPAQGFMTGAVDLTQQPIDPILEKIEGTDIYPPVVGYVTAQPTFAFYARPNRGGTVGVVFAGNNYIDTVLLVHCPNGEWNFADDVKWANADPAIAANLAQEGVYEVWIGTKQSNQAVSGTLYVLVQ